MYSLSRSAAVEDRRLMAVGRGPLLVPRVALARRVGWRESGPDPRPGDAPRSLLLTESGPLRADQPLGHRRGRSPTGLPSLYTERHEQALTDFGVARFLAREAAAGSGTIVYGTPAYLAPERRHGDAAKVDG